MNISSSTLHSNWLVLDRMAMALLIGVTAWLSLTIAYVPGEAAAVWIGNGVFVGWLLSRPTTLWPGYVAAGFVIELVVRQVSQEHALTSATLSACNLLEVMIIACWVRRQVPDIGDPKRWISLGRVATESTLLACAVSGLLAAGILATTSGSAFFMNFIRWYSAHVVGMVIVATLTLVVHREGLGLFALPKERRNFIGSMLVLAVTSCVVFFQSRYPLLFLAYPPLLWGVFKHRFAGLVAGIALLALIASAATALGNGPLGLASGIGLTERVMLLQLFIGTACLISFPVTLSLADRARLKTRLRENELRYRMLADYSHDVIVRMRMDGQRLYVSPSAKDILGWEPNEMLGARWNLVHPDDHAMQLQAMTEVIATGKPHTATYRVRHKDGHYIWIEAVMRPIPSEDHGSGMDIIYTGRDVSRRIAAEQALLASRQELEEQARVDSLTGLANRRQFDERLALALIRLQRHGLPIALMYLDIDHFKQINDTFGHAAGDEVLRTFAQRLKACVRAGDLVVRMGGDEFVVLVEDAILPSDADAIARKLITTMRSGIAVEALTIHATTSIGIAFCTCPCTAKALMSAADAALYAAKKAGRNCYQLHAVEGMPQDTPVA